MRRLNLVLTLLVLGCSPLDSEVPPSDPPTDEPTPEPAPWPATLSETGLFAEGSVETIAEDVIHYEVAWPLWSDGTIKDRFLHLPEGTTIDTSNPNLWDFPVGTRAWKHFSLGDVLLETRFLHREEDGWVWVAYQWRQDGTDADAVPSGVLDASETLHDIPSTHQCETCHQSQGLLGVGAIQLGADSPTSTLTELTERSLLSAPIEGSTAVPGEGATRETLGYLHGNCSGCHADHYNLPDAYTLRLGVLVGIANPGDSLLYQTAINAPTHHPPTGVAVAPGDPEGSLLYQRMGQRSFYQMPPLGTEVVDSDAHATVYEWIMGLPQEQP